MIFKKLKNTFRQYRHLKNALDAKKVHLRKTTLLDGDEKILKEIELKGYAVIPNYYSKEQCQELVSEIDNLFTKFPQYEWKDKFDADHRIYGANRISSLIEKYYSDPFLNRLANAFNGCETINNHTLVGRIQFKENNIGSGQGWHRDSISPYQFKSLLYLTDVDNDHGPFEYLEGSQKLSSMYDCIWKANMQYKQHRITEENIESLIKSKKFKKSTLLGEAGTLVLVNTFGIHRGKPISTGNRYALTNYFFNKFNLQDSYFEEKFNLPPIGL